MKQTKDFFDGYADRWDDVNRYDRPQKSFKDMVSLLGIKKGSKVVDLGCGTGVLLPHILETVGDKGLVYAVDVSDKMLKKLSQKFPADNIKTFALEAEELSKINDSVGAVICFSAFPHIHDKEKAVKEIAAVLRPGGRFLIAHFSSRDEINNFHAGLPEPICNHILPDEKTIRRMFDNFGFNILNFADEPSKYELLAERRNNV